MRILEIGIIVLNLPALLGSVLYSGLRPKWLRWLPLITLLIVLLHFLVEGYRWQMITAYFVSGVLFMSSLWAMIRRSSQSLQTSHRWLALITNVAGIVLLCLSAILSILLPVFSLPTPTGPHSIGTVTYHWVDHTRPEIFTDDTTDVREIMVQIWYPAEHVSGRKPVSYWGRASKTIGRAQANILGLPEFIFDHISLVTTHSYQNAQILMKKSHFPVIIYSHGYGGNMNYSTFNVEELASHGYVVISINHTYDAFVTIFPDARRVIMKDKQFQYPDVSIHSKEEIEALRKKGDPLYERMTDVLFVLDRIEWLNANSSSSPFVNQLDLSRIGAVGYSYGASSVYDALGRDNRIKAVVYLDGGTLTSSVKRPSMYIYHESYGKQQERTGAFQSLASDCYVLSIAGTTHSNFAEGVLITPLKSATGAGSIQPQRTFRIVNDYTLAFFDKYLYNQEAFLLDRLMPVHSEVTFLTSNDFY
ncbi:MAG: hypothetical protein ACE5EE_07750 [Fidelibacterota bacterium]